MVALSQEIVQADEEQLAPEFEPGQRVLYHAPDGSLMDASVGELNTSHWCADCFSHHNPPGLVAESAPRQLIARPG